MRHLFDRWVRLMRPIRNDDGQGGFEEEPFVVGDFYGRLVVNGVADGRFEQKSSHVLYIPADLSFEIHPGDLACIDNGKYEVIGVREMSVTGHHLELDVNSTQEIM